jgi:hypothetical protein
MQPVGYDANPSIYSPETIMFDDSDIDPGEVGGNFDIYPAEDENLVIGYNLYWGTASSKTAFIQNYASTGGMITHNFPINTMLLGATHLWVCGVGPDGEYGGCRSLKIDDYVWFNAGWLYQKKLVIGSPSVNYAMPLTVYMNDGFDNPNLGTIDCEGNCRNNFGDLRFTGPDRLTELDYWISESVPGTRCRVWVETNGDTEIYMYYGNAGAATTGNSGNTFPLYFDHWIVDNTGDFTYTESTAPINHKQQTYDVATFSTEKRIIFTGTIADYVYGGYDRTLIGFTDWNPVVPYSTYIEENNWTALMFEHDWDDPPDSANVWVRIRSKRDGSQGNTAYQSLGAIPMGDKLEIKFIFKSNNVGYRIRNLTTDTILAETAFTNTSNIPDPAVAQYFFIAAFSVDALIFSHLPGTSLSMGNLNANGGMQFDADYFAITQASAGEIPSWNSFGPETAQ